VLAQQITISTFIDSAGKLNASAVIALAAAKVDNAGTENEFWELTGQSKTEVIQDVLQLPPDLSHLQPSVLQLFTDIVTLVGHVNYIRKSL
jgi:hypothetical protein